jgi:Chaperone of endosialidase
MFTGTCNIENSIITRSGNNIGIGTATPASTLHLYGNNSTLTITGTGTHQVNIVGATGGRLGQDAAGFFFSSDTNGGAIRFLTNNGTLHEWMRITSAGNVGLATTTPVSALNVAGTTPITWTNGGISNSGLVTIGTPATGGSLYVNTPSISTSYQSGFAVDGSYGTPANQAVINLRALGVHSGGPYGSQMAFWTTNGTVATPQMLLDQNGNLGVGTTTPAARLEVNGTAKFDGLVTFAGGQSFPGVASLGANIFAGNQTIASGSLVVSSGSVSLTSLTTGAGAGAIYLGGNPFIHACCGDSGNTFLGNLAGNFTNSGIENVGIGDQAFVSVTSGDYNTAVGAFSLYTTSGSENTAVGVSALTYDSTGNGNTAAGTNALEANDTGAFNTAVGDCSLVNTQVSGDNPFFCSPPSLGSAVGNTAIGGAAGKTNTTGAGNTFVGYMADAGSPNLTNATAIGANAVVSASNNLILGGTTDFAVNVGIGTATAAAVLDVEGTAPAKVGSGTGTMATTALKIAGAAGGDTDSGTGGEGAAVSITAGKGGTGSSNGGNGGSITIQPGAGGTGTAAGAAGNVLLAPTAGFVGIGTTTPANTLEVVAGGTTLADAWTIRSSRRWKTNIHTLTGALEKVEQLRGVSYDRKDDGKHEIGVIAEEVGKVVPEVVLYEKNGTDAQGVDYARLTALLIEATKEQQRLIQKQMQGSDSQQKQLQEQRAEIKAQRSLIRKQQSQIARLASQVTIIRASLKPRRRTGRAVRVAKTHAVPTPAYGRLLVADNTGK